MGIGMLHFRRSAAHGNLENVENLLSSGRVSISISLDINRDEFSASIQTLLKQVLPPSHSPPTPPPTLPNPTNPSDLRDHSWKQAVCHVLGSDTCAHESDLSIVSVSDDIPGMGEGKGARQSDSCIAISYAPSISKPPLSPPLLTPNLEISALNPKLG
jgi:hypothetical protein